MINMIKSEFLKFRRTFSKKLVFILPLYVVIYGIVSRKSFGTEFNYFETNTINWWVVLFMPLLIALLCALSSMREKHSGNYVTLKSKDVNMKKIWFSKVIVIGFYTLLSTIELIGMYIIIKCIFFNSISSLSKIIYGSIIIWVTTLILIPICLFISEKFGTFITILMTTIGIVIEVLVSVGNLWFLLPWSISTRLMCPILSIHPNGEMLMTGSELLNPSVIPIGTMISILGILVLSLITSLWFSKKEVC